MKTRIHILTSLLIGLLAIQGQSQSITVPAGQNLTVTNPIDVTGATNSVNVPADGSYKIGGTKVFSTPGSLNLFIGPSAGAANIGSGNLFIGANAGLGNTSGNLNTFIGAGAGRFTTTGVSNLAIGNSAGFFMTGSTASANLLIGTNAGYNILGGNNNLCFGTNAGFNITEGVGNVAIGPGAGGSNLVTGSGNTFVGNNAIAGAAGVSNSVAIGNGTTVNISNAMSLGSGLNVGINTPSPTARLHVVGSVRIEGLPSDGVGAPATQYVVIDAAGNLFRYTGTAPLRQGVVENAGGVIPNSFNENWTLKNDFLYNKNKKGIIIGEGIASLPKGYGMYVTDGILTEKVKVAIKNSSDWADYVFNKDYKKMTLTQVEKFISVNKHLPNMPSAAEMVAEGNDLAKTDAKLLEKIEELTLYMIEMKKENAQMKSQIKSLKRKLK